MDASNSRRIDSLSITPTTPRQTPRNDFGQVIARTAQEVGRVGGDLVGGILGARPVFSAASTGIRAATSALGRTAGVPGEGAVPEQGGSWELLDAQNLLNQQNQQFSLAYLKLQDEMQRESREHTTVSNVMKVRHDSAKAAINNIR
jgi:hypothetical protein